MQGPLKVFTGRAHPALTEEIAEVLGISIGKMEIRDFSDGETYCQILENVRGCDVFVVQPTCPPVNPHVMELLIMLDAFRRASASRITAVLPYYGYARQDRKDKPRVPITSKLIAELLTVAGANRLLTIDLHAPQIQGFYDIPVDHLYAGAVLIPRLKKVLPSPLTVVSPDAGGTERARAFAKRLRADLAIIDKRRTGPNEAKIMNVIGSVKDRVTLIVDDIIDTAGTLVQVAQTLVAQGAIEVYAACTHPVFSGPAVDRVNNAPIKKIFVTNTLPTEGLQQRCSKLEVISLANLLAEAILRIHEEDSISILFA